jgi:hypothetical protein
LNQHQSPSLRRVSRLDECAWLIAHKIAPIGRRMDAAGRGVTWDFPGTQEVDLLLEMLRRYDDGIVLLLDYAEAHRNELRQINRLQREHGGRR